MRTAHTGRDGKRHVGWEHVHVCVDDATRLAYVEVLADEKATTAIGLLRCAGLLRRARHQGPAADDRQRPADVSLAHTLACRALGLRHLRERPYRPRTNGKAERFIRTVLPGWAYGAIYASSQQRTAALSVWLDHYNSRRPHAPSATTRRQPASRS